MVEDTTIKVEDLTVAYHVKPVLWDIDLELPKGKLVAILGPNGAGKSTLIKSMLGLVKPVTGYVEFPEHKTKESLKNSIAYVPQSSSVDWDFPTTVLDVVMMGRYGHLGWVKRPKKEDIQIAKNCLKKMGIEEFANRQISQLSGGQQQRVFLARALAQEAEIYLMDEPLKGVDIQTEQSIMTLLRELKSQNKTVILVHHNLNTVREYFDWTVLVNIVVIASGPTSEVFTKENIEKTYRGKTDVEEEMKEVV